MNDYWNDPPEDSEVPECCDLEMDVDDDGNCKCSKCGVEIKATHEPDEPDACAFEEYAMPRCVGCGTPNGNGCQLCDHCSDKGCPHGNNWGDCGTCDHMADLAYDAARERKAFR